MRYERKRFSFLEKGVVGNSKFEQRRKRELLPLGGSWPSWVAWLSHQFLEAAPSSSILAVRRKRNLGEGVQAPSVSQPLLQNEVASAGLDKPRFLHARELGGKGAAVDSQVIGKLLAIEGDVELVFARSFGDVGQVRQHFAADRFRGNMQNTA